MKVQIPDFPGLPDRISRLKDFVYNLWWSWNGDARRMLREINPVLWDRTGHNAIRVLRETSTERLHQCADDPEFLSLYESVINRYDNYLGAEDCWYRDNFKEGNDRLIAYLCAEFGVHSSLPIYSGGLGVLAGDTCKEASDLGLPFVAIGSLYPEGYFRQMIDADGNQLALYERLSTRDAPILQLLTDDGGRFLVPVPVGNREVKVAVWKTQAGRVPIYLMDTNIEENEPWDRDLSARLYGGDQQVRLHQEIILGMGGVRVLRALGYQPTVFHLNEGHAAFAALELIREHVHFGGSLEDALQAVRGKIVFTTHTPVKAGHDEFPFYMMEEYFRWYWEELRISREDFLRLGQTPDGHSFSMTILALRTAGGTNSVSQKHGVVSREMWHFLWPERKVEEVPIISVTNGVHLPTWLAARFQTMYTRHWGPAWVFNHDDPDFWERLAEIPDEELWALHLRSKHRLLNFVRERARQRVMAEAMSPAQTLALGPLLSSDALTVGFARRFATYKRATLVLENRERLKRILHNPLRPVQILFSGKAHPADEPGKFFLAQIFRACSSPEFGGRLAFIEDYDTHVAHYLVQGVDVWLNNPQPPKEASGTSGQKAAINGIPNCSILDGWWYEGYNGSNGWAIDGTHLNDAESAEALYNLLENEIVPCYYERDEDGIPRRWIAIMKNAIRSSAAQFSSRRMMKQYLAWLYDPVSGRSPEAELPGLTEV
ncbi:MAG TPA: alpha-glucan family phosphorylase [Acidobacteriota bacterium]|nr:alpha-glucan family phosphorylase [Acidobacteriota bacterium]